MEIDKKEIVVNNEKTKILPENTKEKIESKKEESDYNSYSDESLFTEENENEDMFDDVDLGEKDEIEVNLKVNDITKGSEIDMNIDNKNDNEDGNLVNVDGKNQKDKGLMVKLKEVEPYKKTHYLNNIFDIYRENDKNKKDCIIENEILTILNKDKVISFKSKFKISKCTYITKEVKDVVYLCNCSTNKQFIICEECKNTCHKNHIVYEVDNKNMRLTCNCGEDQHEFEDSKGNLKISPKCLMNPIYKLTIPSFYVSVPKPKEKEKTTTVDNLKLEKRNSEKTESSKKNGNENKQISNVNEDIVCGFCFINNLVNETNFINYDYFEGIKQTKIKPIFLEYESSEKLVLDCHCKNTIPFNYNTFIQYFNSVNFLKKSRSYSRFYLLEHNINISIKSGLLANVFSYCFEDINTFLVKDSVDYFVEDNNLMRAFTSLFCILQLEENFKFVEVIDIFNDQKSGIYLNLEDRKKIVKKALSNFSNKQINKNITPQSPILIEIINEYSFSTFQFYIYVKNFFVRYINNFSFYTINNMTVNQRYVYIFSAFKHGSLGLNSGEQIDYNNELLNLKEYLKVFPHMILEWYKKIISTSLWAFFDEDLEIHCQYLRIFAFLAKFDLISDFKISLFSQLIELLTHNVEIYEKDTTQGKVKNIVIFDIDKILEIVYYSMCYYNDKIVLNSLDKNLYPEYKGASFCYENLDNNSEKSLLSKIFTLSISNLSIMKNQLEFIDDSRYSIKMSKINQLIRNIFDLLLGHHSNYDSFSYIFCLENELKNSNFDSNQLLDFDYDNYFSNSNIISAQFFALNLEINGLHKKYFKYEISIHEYFTIIKQLINKDILKIVEEIEKAQKKHLAEEEGRSNSKSTELIQLQYAFKLINFTENLKKMFYQCSNINQFFNKQVLSLTERNIIFRLVSLIVFENFENVVLFTDINYKNVFEFFYDNIENLINLIFPYHYHKDFMFSNHFFITNLMNIYFVYNDPTDIFSFKYYFNSLAENDKLTKKVIEKINLRGDTYDSHYYKLKEDDDLEKLKNDKPKPIVTVNKTEHKNTFTSTFSDSESLMNQAKSLSFFCNKALIIIKSNNYFSNENLSILDLINFKFNSIGKRFKEFIVKVLHEKSDGDGKVNEKKLIIETFIYDYYLLLNYILKNNLFEMNVLSSSFNIIDDDKVQDVNFKVLFTEFGLSNKVAFQILENLTIKMSKLLIKDHTKFSIIEKRNSVSDVKGDSINLDELYDSSCLTEMSTKIKYPMRSTVSQTDNTIFYNNYIIKNSLARYIEKVENVNNEDISDGKLNRVLLNLISFLSHQCECLENLIDESKLEEIIKEIDIFEYLEYGIVKPIIYLSNIFKELNFIYLGPYNLTLFKFACYLNKFFIFIYNNSHLTSTKLKENETSNANLTLEKFSEMDQERSIAIIKLNNILTSLLDKKETIYYKTDIILEKINETLFIISKNKKLYQDNIKIKEEDDDKINYENEADKMANIYKLNASKLKNENNTLIQLLRTSTDDISYGEVLVDYLTDDLIEKINVTCDEYLNGKHIPVDFFNNKNEGLIKKRKYIRIKVNYLSYFINISLLLAINKKDVDIFQKLFASIGLNGVIYADYLVNLSTKNFFFIQLENSKMSFKGHKISYKPSLLDYQIINMMELFLYMTERFNSLYQNLFCFSINIDKIIALNLMNIIYLIDDCSIHNKSLIKLSEIYSDILINIYINSEDKIFESLVVETKSNEANENKDENENDKSNNDENKGSKRNKLNENHPVIALIKKTFDTISNKSLDYLVSLKLNKTYSNICILMSLILQNNSNLIKDFVKKIEPENLAKFITISLKYILVKHCFKVKFNKRDPNYSKNLKTTNDIKLDFFMIKFLDFKYNQNSDIFDDNTFKLVMEIVKLMNLMNVNLEIETQSILNNILEEENFDQLPRFDNVLRNIDVMKYSSMDGMISDTYKLEEIASNLNDNDEIENSLKNSSDKNLKIKVTSKDIKAGLSFAFSKLKKIQLVLDYIPIRKTEIQEYSKDIKNKLIEKYDYNSDSDDDEDEEHSKKLTRIYLISNPMIKIMTPKRLYEFVENADRSSWNNKINEIVKMSKDLKNEIKFNMDLRNSSFWLNYTLDIDYEYFEIFSYIMIFVINLILLFSLDVPELKLNNSTYFIVLAFGLVLLVSNFCAFIIYMSSKFRMYLFTRDKKDFSYSLKGLFDYYIYHPIANNESAFFFISNVVISCIAVSKLNLSFLFTFLLLFFFKFSKNVQILGRAFKISIIQVLMMIFLLFILVWVFSLTSFFFANDLFSSKIGDNTENLCINTLQCFIRFLNNGIRNGDGIGNFIPKENYFSGGPYVGKWFLEMTFFIVFSLLLLNMINGIIINTFTQLKEELDKKEEDIMNNCFICNVERSKFIESKETIENHIKNEHNLLNYFTYIINTYCKEEKDLSYDEHVVKTHLDKNDISIFPYKKYLQGEKEYNDEEE